MEIKILKSEKNLMEIELDNLTLAEILRAYAWKNKSVLFAAWQRTHPTQPVKFLIKSKSDVKKTLKEVIESLKKELKELKTIK